MDTQDLVTCLPWNAETAERYNNPLEWRLSTDQTYYWTHFFGGIAVVPAYSAFKPGCVVQEITEQALMEYELDTLTPQLYERLQCLQGMHVRKKTDRKSNPCIYCHKT